MKFKREHLLLYAVTDRTWVGNSTIEAQVEAAILGGATMVQLREKELTGPLLEQEALSLQKLCQKYQIPFLINDDVELAYKINADGVHIGQNDMKLSDARKRLGADKIIGVTAKTPEQAIAAEAGGADYLGSGAVFCTSTKLDAKALDFDMLDRICDSVSIPVTAIGGICADNILALRGRHISGVAVVSGIFHSPDIEQAARNLRKLAEEIVQR